MVFLHVSTPSFGIPVKIFRAVWTSHNHSQVLFPDVGIKSHGALSVVSRILVKLMAAKIKGSTLSSCDLLSLDKEVLGNPGLT